MVKILKNPRKLTPLPNNPRKLGPQRHWFLIGKKGFGCFTSENPSVADVDLFPTFFNEADAAADFPGNT